MEMTNFTFDGFESARLYDLFHHIRGQDSFYEEWSMSRKGRKRKIEE